MSEILFILIVIYIAYLVFKTKSDNGQSINDTVADVSIVKPPGKKIEELVVQAPIARQSPPKKARPAKSAAKPKPKANKLATPKIELRTVMMKNPATGEAAKVAGNYRMVKRWIKEALVEEGLLEKIYKNNEMDDLAKAKVAEALSIIKAMDKYKV